MTVRGDLLDDAKQAINNERNKSYGEPKDNFADTALLWNAYFAMGVGGDLEPVDLKPHEVASLMILLKLARLNSDPSNKDTWQDIAGYAACGYECADPDPPTGVGVDEVIPYLTTDLRGLPEEDGFAQLGPAQQERVIDQAMTYGTEAGLRLMDHYNKLVNGV